MERTFDRAVKFDERSKGFPVRALLPSKAPRSYTWRHLQLDQGTEGACTGFSATTEAAARPKPVFGDPRIPSTIAKTPQIEQIARQVYHRARQLDEWPGEDYEGSSVLGATKAGQELGWWTRYHWALGPGPEAAANDVIMSLGYRGPVMLGTNWYESMMVPRGDGYLAVAGRVAGGHAWLATAYSKTRDAIWTPNSWGGQGQGWIHRSDLVRLLAEDGEACIPDTRLMPK
jgi:hypothetical protein